MALSRGKGHLQGVLWDSDQIYMTSGPGPGHSSMAQGVALSTFFRILSLLPGGSPNPTWLLPEWETEPKGMQPGPVPRCAGQASSLCPLGSLTHSSIQSFNQDFQSTAGARQGLQVPESSESSPEPG